MDSQTILQQALDETNGLVFCVWFLIGAALAVCAVPVEKVVAAAKAALYTGNYGDGKMFIYDIENVIKIRTGEEGYNALHDSEEWEKS